jgi:heme exporter protein B
VTTSTSAQLRALVRAEILVELRTGHTLWTSVPYAATGLLIVALAVGADVPLLRRIGTGTYWALVLLFGSLICLRQSAADGSARRELLQLLGVDPALRFVARAAVSSLAVLGFQVVLAPVAVVLYDVALTRLLATSVVVILVAVGVGTLGTLAADLVASPGVPVALVPLIVTPLSVPLVLAAVQVDRSATTTTGVVAWLLLALTAVLLFVVAGLLAARPLQEVHP